jgi:hypothetical protein
VYVVTRGFPSAPVKTRNVEASPLATQPERLPVAKSPFTSLDFARPAPFAGGVFVAPGGTSHVRRRCTW